MRIADFHPNRFVAPANITREMQKRYVTLFPEGGTIADLGCGEGIFLDLLKESGRKGIGIDLTQDFINKCRNREHEAHVQDVFEFLNENPGKFDGVFASHLIEHFQTKDGLQLLELIYDSLATNGLLVLITPTYRDIRVSSERFWLDISHVRPYPLPLLIEVFQHLGFKVQEKGFTKDERGWFQPKRIFRNAYYLLSKLRFGRYYGLGDTIIVGKKV
ncbi:MAG: class I SAM-dependent methyltransferase [bacterium]